MKYLKFIIFICFMFASGAAQAEVMRVNTDVLNLRSCPGTECNITAKLVRGDDVLVEDTSQSWAKVHTDKGNGYVSERFLSASEEDSGALSFLWWIFVMFCGISIAFYFYMLPATLAQDNKNADTIYRANLFFGWIPGVWPLLFFAALIGEKRDDA